MFRRSVRLFNNAYRFASQKHLSSSGTSIKNLSNLPFAIIGGAIFVGGGYYITKNQGYFTSKSHIHDNHENEAVVQEKPIIIEGLPEFVPYLIIGAGTAAYSASRSIKGIDPKAKILMITSENNEPYMRPPLSKELWFSGVDLKERLTFKQYSGNEKSIFFEPSEFYLPYQKLAETEKGGISVLTGIRVVKLDTTDRKAFLNNGQVITYDKCLIATGGEPKNLKVFEQANKDVQDRVILFRTVEDFKLLNELLPKAKSITVVGGGFLGSELAVSLAEKSNRIKSNVKINQLFPEDAILDRILPGYLSCWTSKKILDEGVNLLPQKSIIGAKMDNGQLDLNLSNGESLKTDYAVVAVGLKPNIELAESSMLETEPNLGGFLVNAELQTRSNLWVAGDAACFYDQKLGRRRVEHHDHAVVSGRLAGENMTGAGKPYWHQSMFWSDLGIDIGFEAIGIVDSKLPTFGVFASQDEAITEAKSDKTEEFRLPKEDDKYRKGVVFYLRDDTVVGILLWNLYNNMHIARRVLNDGVKGKDLNDVAKLFSIYEKKLEIEEKIDEEKTEISK